MKPNPNSWCIHSHALTVAGRPTPIVEVTRTGLHLVSGRNAVAYVRARIADHWIANVVARVLESTGGREAGTGPCRANWLALRARPI